MESWWSMAWSGWLIDRWQKYIRFTPVERNLVFLSMILLPIIQIGIQLGGLSLVQTILFRIKKLFYRPLPSLRDSDIVPSIVRVVKITGCISLFQPSCLTISLCTWFLLLMYGIETELRIGIARSRGTFIAHAWIEQAGQVLNDRPDIQNFFSPFDASINTCTAGKI